MNNATIKTLAVKLGDQKVGYLSHYHDGKNIFVFDQQYIELGVNRPIFSLAFNDIENEANTLKRLEKTYCTMHALPTFFSNLLPEGSLRDYILAQLKIHPNDEFALLSALAGDLSANKCCSKIIPLRSHLLQKKTMD